MLYALFVIVVGMVAILLAPAVIKTTLHILETIVSLIIIMILFIVAALWEGYELVKKLIKKITGGNK